MLLRDLVSRQEVADAEVAAVQDQVIVLVLSGGKRIESRAGRRTRRADYGPGAIALTAPGRSGRFSWRCAGEQPQRALHLHVPGGTMAAVAGALWDREDQVQRMPDALLVRDPVIEQVMRALDVAAVNGADDLYAESGGPVLAPHLLPRDAAHGALPMPGREDARVRRVHEYMRDNLHTPLTLAQLAAHVHLSPYHLARVFREATGQPPRLYLNRLRVEAACLQLRTTRAGIADIALACGFSSTARLTSAMRRHLGTTPTGYRASTWRR